MCTSIVEITQVEGMAKRGDEWFPLTQAVVAYDHARHAPLGDVITLDFFNQHLDASARAGVEITLELGQGLARRARPRDPGGRIRGSRGAWQEHAAAACSGSSAAQRRRATLHDASEQPYKHRV